ncbi:S-adenosylmethionine-dependent methyltransferase [Agrilactobacillus composti DSM 18527 = JCM 14202]|uniref:tRNA (guanine-N(7)-)-methyltransferase n=1 Tax=Agrilactobacillus composti DSM 18527 = JCM 14202 TaxID=1423734 RepID=X0PE06_9LACO|nr:tRNA (guanosine(46)-N7)-methyltransferase TrmB [Agrilactobacillus composti]KRM35767.1 S-adenosylmethionine-dependent methyltransferase [Agrilactobacillus composti DSM 18527 = JCM 14202]GAF39629.1 tRNA (guanine46-N7-)-methyltransferase [Agrilactobacillus composti DSM 18527 = JCM 14202]
MRLRNKPWAKELIAAHPAYILVRPETIKGHWQTRFETEQPLRIEIGSGKGQFIVEMAKALPQFNFIAVEVQEAAIAMILKKQVAAQLPNLQLLYANGADLGDYFAPDEVAQIYLNFSDPWPKTRHEKRRLTYQSFLRQYQTILQPQGKLAFKTDNLGLFEYSLVSLSQFGLILDFVSLDLHHDPRVTFNIETEYETKFATKGQPIYQLKAHFK